MRQLRGLLAIALCTALPRAAEAQAQQFPAMGASLQACMAQTTIAPGDADRALARGQYDEARQLFSAMPASDAAIVGQIRALVGQHESQAALTMARQAVAQKPNNALLLDGLGQVQLARGEPVDAAASFAKALGLNPCLAQAHYDFSRYLDLSGLPASGQKELEVAYRLQPADPTIRRAWRESQRPVPTPESQIADLRQIEARPGETSDQKAEIESVISALQAESKGDCELVSPNAVATIALTPVFTEDRQLPPSASDIEVVLNGKKRLLLLDTGATGLTISREAAEGLGLVPEAQVTSHGVGGNGVSSEYLSHVQDLKIGSLEFRNCRVRVQDRAGALSVQGLFGADLLRGLLLTIDFPRQELRTQPLPTLPGDTPAAKAASVAAAKKDRAVDPRLRDWTPAFRQGGALLVATSISGGTPKLFVLDSGTEEGLIAAEVAREVTTVSSRPGESLRGVGGTTTNLAVTGPLTLGFGGLSVPVREMTALDDLSGFTAQGAARIAGFVGYDVLRRSVLSLDYRDALIRVTEVTP